MLVCPKCGARRVDQQIGLEQSPDEYVEHLVEVFREVRRVMRDDGTLWLNLGDSYATQGGRGEARMVELGRPSPGAITNPAARGSTSGIKNAPGLKPKDLCGIPWRVAFALQADGCADIASMRVIERVRSALLEQYEDERMPDKVLYALDDLATEYAQAKGNSWWLRSDIIWAKCLSGGTKLYARTQNGEGPATVKDLVRLDPSTVQLWDGAKWNQVHSWEETQPSENRQLESQRRRTAKYRGEDRPVTGDIEIELRSGERIGCTREHRWPTRRGIVRAKDLLIGDVLDTAQLPEPKNAREPSLLQDAEIAWFVGMYLAEGSMSKGTIQISSHISEQQRYRRLSSLATAFDGHCFQYQTSDNGMTININSPILAGVLEAYISGRTAKTKHLNTRCWMRSNRFLACLIQGYLDGDGSQKGDGYWRLGFTSNDALASDLRTIAARLGYSIRLRRRKAYIGEKAYPCWRGDLQMNSQTRRTEDAEIVAFHQSRARKFWNISLIEDPHTFCLASGVCTKNSNPMPESVTDRPTKAHEYVFLLTKSARYYYDAEAVKENGPTYIRRAGGYQDAGSGIGEGTGGQDGRRALGFRDHDVTTVGRNRRDVWTVNTASYEKAHFATFPPKLIEPMILAGTSAKGCCPICGTPWEREAERTGHINQRELAHVPNNNQTKTDSTGWAPLTRSTNNWHPTCSHYDPGIVEPIQQREHWMDPVPCIVLDPFGGSGTTAAVAKEWGREYVIIELNPDYIELAKERINETQPRLLTEIAPTIQPSIEQLSFG